MKKSDLKTGHIVELRNGDKYVVLLDVCKNNLPYDTSEGIISNGGFMELSEYTGNMKNPNDEFYDIVAVYLPERLPDVIHFGGNTDHCKEIWRRPEPVKKTVAELKEYYEATTLREVEVVDP